MNKKMLNLGCGNHFHNDWTNIDFVSYDKNVIAHNLLKGIPSNDEEFDVIYHSHVLEHFPKNRAQYFINECHRALKSGGIIRIAVPDLETIAKLYLKNLENAYEGSSGAQDNYEWIMLEMYDQVVRTKSGGAMLDFLKQENINNWDFVEKRLGDEANSIRKLCQNQINTDIRKKSRTKEEELLESAKFRQGGEIHQWMYDRYSLKRLLSIAGFTNIEIKSAFDSNIPNWKAYNLDIKDGKVRKPDSLFMEAVK